MIKQERIIHWFSDFLVTLIHFSSMFKMTIEGHKHFPNNFREN